MGFKIAVVQVHVERPVGGAGAASSLRVYPKKPKFLKVLGGNQDWICIGSSKSSFSFMAVFLELSAISGPNFSPIRCLLHVETGLFYFLLPLPFSPLSSSFCISQPAKPLQGHQVKGGSRCVMHFKALERAMKVQMRG